MEEETQKLMVKIEEIRREQEEISRKLEKIRRDHEEIRKDHEEIRRYHEEIRRDHEEIFRRIQKVRRRIPEEGRIRFNENNNEMNIILGRLHVNKIEDINKLNDENKKCVICLEDFKNNDKSIYLPCFHLFHEKCITDWINMNKRFCPFCKTIINNMMK